MKSQEVSFFVLAFLMSGLAHAEESLPAESTERQGSPDAIIAPQPLTALSVTYPEGANGEATVLVELSIDEQGHVSHAVAITGAEPFASQAQDSAKQWLFRPATRNGVAVATRIRIEVTFSPPEPALEPDAPATQATQDTPAAQTTPEAPAPAPGGGSAQSAEATDESSTVADEEPATVDVLVQGERTVGVTKLGRAEVRQMPGAFGDPYRAVEALPGVTPIASGLPYFYVRGAPPGNVGYFFDDIPVPLLYHVAAGPGVLHPAFVSSVDLYSGAYPARYGRYAGGIVSGEAADPEYEFRGEASIRLVDAGAFLEVPFADGKGNAMVAGRYSYTGLVISLLAPDVSLGYWDYQARVQYDLSPNDTVSVFGFGSHDYLAANNAAGVEQEILDLTFHRLTTKWDHAIDTATDLDFAVTLGTERTGVGGDPDGDEEDPGDLRTRSVAGRFGFDHRFSKTLRLRSGADAKFSRFDAAISTEFDDDDEVEFEPSPEHQVEAAVQASLPVPGFPEGVLTPLEAVQRDEDLETLQSTFTFSRDDVVAGAWVETIWRATPEVTFTPGFRIDVYDTGGEVALAPEPRLAARFDVTNEVSLTHALGVAHQPPSFAIPIPGLSGASSDGLQRAVQSSAGVEVQLPWKLTTSATVFQNVILNSTDVLSVSNLAQSDPGASAFSDRTTNHSYGLELYLKRSLTERLGGFLAYTLSRSSRTIPRVSGISSFDRTHVVNAALAFDLGRMWRLGLRTVVYSGIPAEVAYAEAAVNPPRTPWYYRFDWRLEKRWRIGTEGAWWALVAEVLNTTLNKEVLQADCYAYGCRTQEIGPVTIPSIGVEASF